MGTVRLYTYPKGAESLFNLRLISKYSICPGPMTLEHSLQSAHPISKTSSNGSIGYLHSISIFMKICTSTYFISMHFRI